MAARREQAPGVPPTARATPRLIARGDLVAALDRAATRKVTIISAPAGSGKTSLLRAWADHLGQPRRLALLDAVRHVTGANRGAERPAATPDFNGRAMVDRVLSELADQRSRLILIIEDLHALTSPDELSQLIRLLAN